MLHFGVYRLPLVETLKSFKISAQLQHSVCSWGDMLNDLWVTRDECYWYLLFTASGSDAVLLILSCQCPGS